MRLLRLPAVQDKTGLKHTSIYEGMAAGTFPKSVALGIKGRAWIEEEIDAWIADLRAKRDGEAA